MAGSSSLKDYFGAGNLATRPSTLTLAAGTAGYWWASDVKRLSVWNGATWDTVAEGLSDPTTVTSSRSLQVGDRVLLVDSASSIDLTVPNSSTVTFAIGHVVEGIRLGLGAVNFVAASGVTLLKEGNVNARIANQNGTAGVMKIDTNTWVLTGALELIE